MISGGFEELHSLHYHVNLPNSILDLHFFNVLLPTYTFNSSEFEKMSLDCTSLMEEDMRKTASDSVIGHTDL